MGERGKDEVGAARRLPVSGEVGSEGGSYADATLQQATHAGELDAAGVEPEPRQPGAVSEAVAPGPQEPEDGVHAQAPSAPVEPKRDRR